MSSPVIAQLRADVRASKDEAEAVDLIYKSLPKLPDATKHLLEEAAHLDEFHRITPDMQKKADEQAYKFSDADRAALDEQQKAFDDTADHGGNFSFGCRMVKPQGRMCGHLGVSSARRSRTIEKATMGSVGSSLA
jgi:hypothetical protein